MAGNSERRGATRKAGSKKAPGVGTGGHGRKALEGKGPTPKAEDRPYHAAHKRKVAQARGASAARPAATGRPGAGRPGGGRSAASGRGRQTLGKEVVGGRNSVLEALRAGVPASTVYLAARLESDDRTREIIAIAADAGMPIL